MHILTSESRADFLTRFCSFNDAVIRRIVYCYLSAGSHRMTVELSVQDQQEPQGWSNIILILTDVSEISFREGESTRQVLSDGLILVIINDQVFCDFSPYSSDASEQSLDDLRRSDFYAIGSTILWDVRPYSEE